MNRYQRQTLLPLMGEAGQRLLGAARVLLVGCGALGGTLAEHLARSGVGHLTLVDRDIVELTNLQRQVLFDESDASNALPKAVAARRRLEAVNSTIAIQSVVADVHAGNIEQMVLGENSPVDLILDGTDNAETRYLLNDVAVRHGIPWIYGGCVGTEGRLMVIRPGVTPCLRCLFPMPPSVGELATCDTTGVLGPAVAVVAAWQVVAAIKLLSGNADAVERGLVTIDFWNNRHRSIDAATMRVDCPCCGEGGRFEFLDRAVESNAITLCGRNSVQIRPAGAMQIDLVKLQIRLASLGPVQASAYLLRSEPADVPGTTLTIFPDGRCIVQGTTDPARARSLVSRFVGV